MQETATQGDVIDFNVSLSLHRDLLVAEASSPLGESYGTSTRPTHEELTLDLHKLGVLLFRCLFPAPVESLYQRSRGRLASTGKLRLRIRAPVSASSMDLVRIHAIPWEVVRDPHDAGFLALDPQIQLVRYVNIPAAVPEAPDLGGRDLEVLAAVASPLDQTQLRWEDEHAALERALANRSVRITLLRHATRTHLLEALATDRYDVLHFIGHGAGPTAVRAGRIALETASGASDWITARELALITQVTSSLRLVFLNACSTAALVARSHRNLASSVGPSLALRGVPAVVAMTSTVYDSQATLFTSTAYAGLGNGATVEAAVHAARIAARLSDFRQDSWRVPVVFSRMTAGQAAPKRAAPDAAHYVVTTKVDELRGNHVQIVGGIRKLAATDQSSTDRVSIDVDAKTIVGDIVTIAGVIDSDRRNPQ